MQNKFVVYILIRAKTNLPMYVGKGTNKRPSVHIANAKNEKRKKTHLESIIAKDIRNGFGEPIIQIIGEYLLEADAFELEKQLICKYGRLDLQRGSLLNKTDGGEGVSGTIISQERREQIRKLHKGRKNSPATIEKMKLSALGKKMSDAAKEKMKIANLGKKLSDETKNRMSNARIGNKNSLGFKHSEETKAKRSENIKLSWEKRRKQKIANELANRNVGDEVKLRHNI